VGGLYLFTTYALPLTTLSVAFGSDCLMLTHLGFPANSSIIICLITYADGKQFTKMGINFSRLKAETLSLKAI